MTKEFEKLERAAFEKMSDQLGKAIEQHVKLSIDIDADALTKFVYDMVFQAYVEGKEAGYAEGKEDRGNPAPSKDSQP